MSKFKMWNPFANSMVELYREKTLIELLAEENEYCFIKATQHGILFDVQEELYDILIREIEKKLR